MNLLMVFRSAGLQEEICYTAMKPATSTGENIFVHNDSLSWQSSGKKSQIRSQSKCMHVFNEYRNKICPFR